MSSSPTNDTVSPWAPIQDSIDLKHLGKLAEEVNELGAAIARCIIQGVDQSEPVTGKVNREWLEEEIADVMAGMLLVTARFKLDPSKICERRDVKMMRLQRWHNMEPWNG